MKIASRWYFIVLPFFHQEKYLFPTPCTRSYSTATAPVYFLTILLLLFSHLLTYGFDLSLS